MNIKKSAQISTFDGAGFWKNAYAHQRGKLLKAVQVPDEQIKILAQKSYPELHAPLRYEIETNGKNKLTAAYSSVPELTPIT